MKPRVIAAVVGGGDRSADAVGQKRIGKGLAMESRDEAFGERVERVLARNLDVGAVNELRSGVIEIGFDGQAMRVSVERCWIFMELMSEASRQFAHGRLSP